MNTDTMMILSLIISSIFAIIILIFANDEKSDCFENFMFKVLLIIFCCPPIFLVTSTLLGLMFGQR